MPSRRRAETTSRTAGSGISISDRAGTLGMRVGPLVKGGGERLMDEMEVPGAGSLRTLTSSMEVTEGQTSDGRARGVPRVRGHSVV